MVDIRTSGWNRVAETLIVGHIAAPGPEKAELVVWTGFSGYASAGLGAWAGVVDRDAGRDSLARIAIGLSVTTAHRLIDLGAGLGGRYADTDVVGHVASPRLEQAKFTLGARRSHDTAARRTVFLLAAVDENVSLVGALVLGAAFGEAEAGKLVPQVFAAFLAGIGDGAMPSEAFKQCGSSPGGTRFGIAVIGHAGIVDVQGLMLAACLAVWRRVTVFLHAAPEGGLRRHFALLLGAAVVAAFAIHSMCQGLALSLAWPAVFGRGHSV